MTAEQALIRLYQQTARRLRAKIRVAIASRRLGTAAYMTQQLAGVDRELRALGQKSRPLAARLAFDEYVRGTRVVDVGLGRTAATFEFAGAHRRAVAALADNIANGLAGAERLIGRRTQDAFRAAALEEVAAGVAGGETRRSVSRGLEERLLREKVTDALTGFVDRRGARWQLETYTKMVARTTTREAVSAGTANRMRELDLDLIEISSHNTETEICQLYEGKTFSLDGKTPGYDVIDQLPPFHPNCLHIATPAGSNLDALEEQLGISQPSGGDAGEIPPRDPKLPTTSNPSRDAESLRRAEDQAMADAIAHDPGPEVGAGEARDKAIAATDRQRQRALNRTLGPELSRFIDRKWGKEAGIRRRLHEGDLTIEQATELAVEEWDRIENAQILREADRQRDYGYNKGQVPCFDCGRFKRRPADVCFYCGDDPVTYGGDRGEFNREYGYATV